MKTWSEIYSERLNDSYYEYFKKQYRPFLNELKDHFYSNKHHSSVELGCGIGNVSRFLVEYSIANDLTLIDSCPEMLGMAIKNTVTSYATYKCDDIRDYWGLENEIIHSHGVLEHFQDNEIKQLVNRNRDNIQVHYVPTDKWDFPSRGDERLLSKEYWINLTNPEYVVEFNEGKDLVIVI